jgi:glycosyltransferase involved in cell wall biosynthesis
MGGPIRIAFIIDTIQSPTAGTEKQLLLLIERLDRRRFRPFLCVLRDSQWLRSEFSACPVFEAGEFGHRGVHTCRSMWVLARYLKSQGIDIVQTFFRDANMMGVVAARLAGIGRILSTRRNQGYWHSRGELASLRFLNRWVTLFVANSESTALHCHQAEKVAAKKIRVIYNGIDIEGIREVTLRSKGCFRADLNLPGDALLVGMVANLRPVKGVEVFLRAARRVLAAYPAVYFVVVGDGSERGRLMELAGRLAIAHRVIFCGMRRDVPYVLASVDVAVLSSFSESFSNAVLEYMAAGLPVVTTEVGGARELIENGVNGFVVPVGDEDALASGILKIIRNNMFDRMSINNTVRSHSMFHVNKMIASYGKLYEDLVN